MAFGGHTTWYASSVKYAAVATWSNNGGAGTVYAAGSLVKQSGTPTVGNERVYVAIVGGTGGTGADPLTVFTRGNRITDGTVTWQEATGIPALNGDLTNTPTWATSRAVSTNASLGHVIKDNAGTHIFICSVSGTVGAVEPTWTVGAVGNTTTDNGATWVYLGTSFSVWVAPHARVQNMLAAGWGDSGTSTKFYLGNDSAETQASALSWTARGTNAVPIDIVTVNVAGSMPPVAADETTGATITTTGNSAMDLRGALRQCSGIVFTAGTSSSPSLQTSSDELDKFYKDCTFAFGTGAGASSQLDSFNNVGANIEMENCNIKFSNAGQTWSPQGRVRWNKGSLDSGGTAPTTFLSTVARTILDIRNVDLSFLSTKTFMPSNQNVTFDITLTDCKIPASWTVLTPATMVSTPTDRSQRVRLVRCSSTGIDYKSEVYGYAGIVSTETTAVRTGGASNGSTAFSWKFVSSSASNFGLPLRSMPFAKYNGNVDPTSVVVSVFGIINAAAVPNDNDIWIETTYLGDATSAQGSTKTSRPSVLSSGTALTADSASAWDSVAAARANTTAYVVGDMISLATNPGRLFFCTTSGTSAGSEPAGYASAVDGGSVTDNTAVFRAGCRFKLTVTLSSPKVQLGGFITALVMAAKVSTTYYVDPFINLS